MSRISKGVAVKTLRSDYRSIDQQLGLMARASSNHAASRVMLRPRMAALYLRGVLGNSDFRRWRLWPLQIWIAREWHNANRGGILMRGWWLKHNTRGGGTLEVRGRTLRPLLRRAWRSNRNYRRSKSWRASHPWGFMAVPAVILIFCAWISYSRAVEGDQVLSALDAAMVIVNAATIRTMWQKGSV